MAEALDRFVTAQAGGVFERALAELRAGGKRSHWMWFVFPQVAGLGRSDIARFYAIRDLAEARGYLAHEVLGVRLIEAATTVMDWAGRRSAEAIFGGIDAIKLRSSATLFEAAGGDAVFGRVIDAFYDGDRDTETLRLIGV